VTKPTIAPKYHRWRYFGGAKMRLCLLRRPDCRRLNLAGNRRPLIGSPAPFETTDQLNRHVRIARDLATESDAGLGHFASTQGFLFGFGNLVRFTFDKSDTASRASCVTAASVQLIRCGLFNERFDETSSRGNIKFADTLDIQLWHTIDLSA
jgi:hypothetical protein